MAPAADKLEYTQIGRNVRYAIDGDETVIRIKHKLRGDVSPSGKTISVATTSGNKEFEGTGVTFGINAYVTNPNKG